MSGIEVVGLVLGIMPLVIAAFEDYSNSLVPMKAWFRWERELPNNIRALRDQDMQFRLSLQILLSPLATHSDLVDLLDNPTSRLWQEAELEDKLRNGLGDTYSTYISIIRDFQMVMERIIGCLDIDLGPQINHKALKKALEVSKTYDRSRIQFKKRTKYGWSKKKINILLAQLEKHNNFLKTLNENMIMLEPYRKTRSTQAASSLQRIRDYADSLHRGLRLTWSSDCHPSHSAFLQLERRIKPKSPSKSSGKKRIVQTMKQDGKEDETHEDENDIGVDSDNERFRLLLIVKGALDSREPLIWQEADVLIQEMDQRNPSCTQKDPSSQELAAEVQLAVNESTVPTVEQPRRNVKYAKHDAKSIVVISDLSNLQNIEDLCPTIQTKCFTEDCRLSFYIDALGKLRGTQVTKTLRVFNTYPSNIITLEELLSNPPYIDGITGLTIKERYKLAITLASSLLQLYMTPWLSDSWSKKDITFVRTSTNSKRPVDIEQPFVVATFGSTYNQEERIDPSTSEVKSSLLALAVILLELALGQPVECQQRPEDASQFLLVRRWIKQQEENLSKAFYSASCYCMSWYADPRKELHEPEFRQEILNQVVVPLRDELENILSHFK